MSKGFSAIGLGVKKDEKIAPATLAKTHYTEQIETNAKDYGYKAANLIFLQEKLGKVLEGQKLSVKVGVPEFLAIPHELIQGHLNDHAAPQWKDLFTAYQASFEQQSDQRSLSPETTGKLAELQECITTCFKNHTFDVQALLAKSVEFQSIYNSLKDGALALTARSTGSHEDKVDIANPGGNESVVTNKANLSEALGVVAASYVGAKSLSQRLKADDTTITEDPVMPVLLQCLVGEGLSTGTDHGKDEQVVSGVMYNNEGSTRMQYSYGHGEYVVNSKGPVDNTYVSQQGVVYSETHLKHSRLVPKINPESHKIKLETVGNSVSNAYSSAIPAAVLRDMHEVACEIEKLYGMRMDIEFVYEPAIGKLNIVQARPIPEGSRKGIAPSALATDFLAKEAANLVTIKALNVITPEVNRAAVITDPSEVIICDKIEQALNEYLTKDSSKVKAVIVRQPSPDTSHEAGQFSSKAIAVIQVNDLDIAKKLLSGGKPVVIDPQHGKLYQLEGHKNSPDLEQALYKTGVLREGIFASPLSAYVSPPDYQFKATMTEDALKKPIDNALETLKNSDQTLGELIATAHDLTNPEAASKSQHLLFSIAFSAMHASKGQMNHDGDDLAISLKEQFESLQIPKVAANNQLLKDSLGYILTGLANSHKQGHISKEVFQHAMIVGAEMAIMLDQIEQSQGLDKASTDHLIMQYFNIAKKFEGLVMAQAPATTVSRSVVQDLAEEAYKLDVQKQVIKIFRQKYTEKQLQRMEKDQVIEKTFLSLTGFKNLPEAQVGVFYDASKLGQYLINPAQKGNWLKFCLESSKNPNTAIELSEVVKQVVSNNIQTAWMNLTFTENYVKANSDNEKTLESLVANFRELTELKDGKQESIMEMITKAQRLITELKAQISLWSDPSAFDKLYNELHGSQDGSSDGKLLKIRKLLEFNKDASDLEKMMIMEARDKMIDALDLTCKAVQTSTQYGNKIAQAQNFAKLINIDFYELMKEQVKYGNYEDAIDLFWYLDRFIKEHSHNRATQEELFIPADFDVTTVIVGTDGLFKKGVGPCGFVTRFSSIATTASLHTLLHQNAITANTKLSNSSLIIKQLPQCLAPLISGETTITITGSDLEIKKNYSLREHSSNSIIKYNIMRNREIEVEYKIFGTNEAYRWDRLAYGSKAILKLLKHSGVQIITEPSATADRLSFKIVINLSTTDSIKATEDLIGATNRDSFVDGSIDKATNMQQDLFKRLIEKHLASDQITIEIMRTISDHFSFVHTDSLKEHIIKTIINSSCSLQDKEMFLIESATSRDCSTIGDYYIKNLFNEEFLNKTDSKKFASSLLEDIPNFLDKILATCNLDEKFFLNLLDNHYNEVLECFNLAPVGFLEKFSPDNRLKFVQVILNNYDKAKDFENYDDIKEFVDVLVSLFSSEEPTDELIKLIPASLVLDTKKFTEQQELCWKFLEILSKDISYAIGLIPIGYQKGQIIETLLTLENNPKRQEIYKAFIKSANPEMIQLLKDNNIKINYLISYTKAKTISADDATIFAKSLKITKFEVLNKLLQEIYTTHNQGVAEILSVYYQNVSKDVDSSNMFKCSNRDLKILKTKVDKCFELMQNHRQIAEILIQDSNFIQEFIGFYSSEPEKFFSFEKHGKDLFLNLLDKLDLAEYFKEIASSKKINEFLDLCFRYLDEKQELAQPFIAKLLAAKNGILKKCNELKRECSEYRDDQEKIIKDIKLFKERMVELKQKIHGLENPQQLALLVVDGHCEPQMQEAELAGDSVEHINSLGSVITEEDGEKEGGPEDLNQVISSPAHSQAAEAAELSGEVDDYTPWSDLD